MENSLKKNNKSSIYNAILKYGHSNFAFTIIEYCEPEKCIEREDYYLSYLKHEYNILPGSRLGHKVSDKTKQIIRILLRKLIILVVTRRVREKSYAWSKS